MRQHRHEVNPTRDVSARHRRPSGQSRLIAAEPVPTRPPAPRPSPSPRDPCGKRLFPVVSTTCTPNLSPDVTGGWKPSRYIRHRGRAFRSARVTPILGERPTKANPLDDLRGRSTEFVPSVSHERHLADAPRDAPTIRPLTSPPEGPRTRRFPHGLRLSWCPTTTSRRVHCMTLRGQACEAGFGLGTATEYDLCAPPGPFVTEPNSAKSRRSDPTDLTRGRTRLTASVGERSNRPPPWVVVVAPRPAQPLVGRVWIGGGQGGEERWVLPRGSFRLLAKPFFAPLGPAET